MGVILTLICGVFSEELISCVIDSEGIREYGTPLVRTLLLSGPVMGILFIYINTLQAIGAEAAKLFPIHFSVFMIHLIIISTPDTVPRGARPAAAAGTRLPG